MNSEAAPLASMFLTVPLTFLVTGKILKKTGEEYEENSFSICDRKHCSFRGRPFFFLYEWAHDRYMTGNGDGLAQMIILSRFF